MNNRKRTSLVVTLFGVIAMSILVACAGGITSESSKSSGSEPATESESPLALLEDLTKVVESAADGESAGAVSAIAALIQGAGSEATELLATGSDAGQTAETLAKTLLNTATSTTDDLADEIAKIVELEQPLMETLMQAAEDLLEGLSDETSSGLTSAEELIGGLLGDDTGVASADELIGGLLDDDTVLSLISETLTDSDSQPSAEQESTAVAATTYDEFDFTLTMDQGSEVQTAQGSANAQGAINFPVGGVNSILTWVPQEGSSPLALVSGAYDILKASQTNVSFASVNDGEITVNGQNGVYLGFKSADDTWTSLGGGLIGAWACADAGTAYTLTLTGADAGTAQIRFDRILENFTYAA